MFERPQRNIKDSGKMYETIRAEHKQIFHFFLIVYFFLFVDITQLSGFKLCLRHLLARRTWANDLTLLSISFQMCRQDNNLSYRFIIVIK